jgi:hypothetical protein
MPGIGDARTDRDGVVIGVSPSNADVSLELLHPDTMTFEQAKGRQTACFLPSLCVPRVSTGRLGG